MLGALCREWRKGGLDAEALQLACLKIPRESVLDDLRSQDVLAKNKGRLGDLEKTVRDLNELGARARLWEALGLSQWSGFAQCLSTRVLPRGLISPAILL